MEIPVQLVQLDLRHSSYLLLAVLAALVLATSVLHRIGILGWLVGILGVSVRWGIRAGFRLWERLLAWTTWPLFLTLVFSILTFGEFAGHLLPGLKIVCGVVPLMMGTMACLAYMFVDLERYEVERGYKAVHNPVMGQGLAVHLTRYGRQLLSPMLIAATAGMICGFAMLNLGLYETVGRTWYRIGEQTAKPTYIDFVAYALIKLLNIVDVLDLARSRHFVQTIYIQPAQWPASMMLNGFRAFFTMVLLQQIFASVRKGKLLAETISDFWSPHEPIHERARHALPQYGALAIGPLLTSLRSLESLTKEQRDQLPLILETIGPTTIPALTRHLDDSHEHVRAVAAAALGRLHAVDTTPMLVILARDPSEFVRLSAVEALGSLGLAGLKLAPGERHARRFIPQMRGIGRILGWKKRVRIENNGNAVEQAVAALESALGDPSAAVRTHAAMALGRIGPSAKMAAPGLTALFKDADETVRCQAAESLGQIGGDQEATASALVVLLQDASAAVKESAAKALGSLQKGVAPSVAALVPLLQDQEESVRKVAAQAIARVGHLNVAASDILVEGLDSADNVVRAQTAEALGTIGAIAGNAAPALVQAMDDGNDYVRAKSVEALGKIGEAAAGVAVPSLVKALRDQDNWVSALAAEALGEMGESAEGAIPALVRSLTHFNQQVRMNAAEALGKMGEAASKSRLALERAAKDDEGGVRSQALRALGAIGCPTATSIEAVLAGLNDPDPLVRTAAVEAVGQWNEASEEVLAGLTSLLEDANDRVKVETTRVLPRLAGPTPAVIDGLCRRLLEDDSAWVQAQAALALGKLGPAATAAGAPLLRAALTGEMGVREQAMRALAMIQAPEAVAAFAAGLKDANCDIRKVASAGWMRAASIPEEAISVLIDALRDPEAQVRANAAHALARLDALPTPAIPLLIQCVSAEYDGLRINAVAALKLAPQDAVAEVMNQLLSDSNARVRLIAAGCLLSNSDNSAARVVVEETLRDPSLQIRRATLNLVESLGRSGVEFLEALKQRDGQEMETEIRHMSAKIIERLVVFAADPLPIPKL